MTALHIYLYDAATPPSITCETEISEITETLSRLRLCLDEQYEQEGSLVSDESGSIDSKVAVMIHPPANEIEISENLYLDLPIIYQEVQNPAAKPQGATRRQLRHRSDLQMSETHKPGAYCPTLSPFEC